MNAQPVLFSRAAASCRLTLNREDKCHAINEEMIELLDRYLSEIENDTALRLVELTATGDKFFVQAAILNPGPLIRRWIWAENGLNAVMRFFPACAIYHSLPSRILTVIPSAAASNWRCAAIFASPARRQILHTGSDARHGPRLDGH
jgi:hypothetical protein